MELLLLYVILLNLFDFSSGITYNKGDIEKYFTCSSQGLPQKNEIFKLYLSLDDLKIQCIFQPQSEISSREFMSAFTSGGLAPSLGIINSTYTGIFHFNLTLFRDQIYWLICIPRENITKNTDTAAVEEWLVRITLQHGLNIYTSEGTLLDRAREPILQWKLGTIMTKDDVKKLYPHVVGLKVTKCPCANDVALIGFLLNSKSNGIYIGLSFSGFWNYNNITWYNLTDMIYSEVGEEHTELSVVDMVLTNHFLVILTSLGLFISGDLRYPSSSVLTFSRADFCGFERVDYVKGKLWYNERCFANRAHFEVDYVTVTFERNRTLSEESSCFYSKEPFHDWLPCLPHISKGMKTISSAVITFLVDQEHSSGVFLLRNQVWLSIDGGNTFELLADFHNDIIKNTYHSFYTSDITLVSQNGKVYLTKAGLERYSEVGSITDKIFTLYYDHMGFIHKLTPDRFEDSGSFTSFGNSKGIFGQAPNMGFETALAPQYITLDEMIFYAYVPENENQKTIYTKKFNNIHSGKVIHSRKTGTAYIRKILQHDTPKGFLSSVIAEVIDPFGIENVNESPCLSSSLSINPDGNFYKLTLQLQPPGVVSSFQDSDIEKTVVIPGYSSFLITRIIDDQNALAIATMPIRAPENTIFVKDTWFLYNFGQRNGQTWSIYEKPCNYWFQQHDDLRSLNVLKYVDLGKSQTLKVEVIPDTKGVRTLEIPLLKVIVGNPTLLEVKAKGSFDDTYSYLMEVSAASTAFQQGSTSLAFVVWGASTDCFVTTFVPTLKSSCSYLKSMHHIPSKFIPPEDWISGVHTDSQGFNMIKTLPVNYRPPSNMGIAIPLTDNFYHADPSKPIPRNLFHKSKVNNISTDKLVFTVPRFKFPVTQYPVSLEIHSEDGQIPVETPYLVTVTEVNRRENWELSRARFLL
ncbi:cation channel sperm-associated protein subunit beta [Pteropus vampyrus]|uniref:Cation channel sperm-associated protein subunit beta n=1 Tax=Pteropus vampyrus TaxID=132908 RepID=A0A6P6D3N1_PTEVA|nr:cation channel sperm-associated protein subunit beta [Pteropus vampyrus]